METLLTLVEYNLVCVAISIVAVLWLAWSWMPALPSGPFDWFESRRELARLVEVVNTNPHNATAQAELGRMLVVRGRHGEAIHHLETAVQRMETSPEPHYFLGLAHLGMGDWRTGYREIELSLQLRPELHYGEPHLRLGDFQAFNGNASEAVGHFTAFTRVNASSSEGFYKLGVAQLAVGNREAAREAWKESMAAYAHSPAYKRVNRTWSWRAWWALRRG